MYSIESPSSDIPKGVSTKLEVVRFNIEKTKESLAKVFSVPRFSFGVKEYIAPCYIISKPGVKRVLYAHKDSIWYNTHKNPTNTKDIELLEKDLVAINYKEYEEYINQKK